MKCLVCGNNFYYKKNLMNLFTIDKDFVCKKCLPRKINIILDEIIIENKSVLVYALSNERIDRVKYYYDYNNLALLLMERKDAIVVFFDTFTYSESTYNFLKFHNIIFPFKNLIVLCERMKN